MKKFLLISIPLLLAVAIFIGFAFFYNRSTDKGALQVTANPKSNVYLNGQLIGQTPLCKCELPDMLPVGEYTIRVTPLQSGYEPFESKVTVGKTVLTVLDRTFGKGPTGEGSIITLSPLEDKEASELSVLSFPQGASVLVDNGMQAETPYTYKNLTISDHDVKLGKTGYREKLVRIRTAAGYRVTTLVFLGVNPDGLAQTPTSAVSPTASPSAAIAQKVRVLQTPNGFLNVRSQPSTAAGIVTRLNTGDIVDLVSEQEGWYEVRLSDGTTGWISNQYARKE